MCWLKQRDWLHCSELSESSVSGIQHHNLSTMTPFLLQTAHEAANAVAAGIEMFKDGWCVDDVFHIQTTSLDTPGSLDNIESLLQTVYTGLPAEFSTDAMGSHDNTNNSSNHQVQCFHTCCEVGVTTRVAVLAETSLRSPRKIFIFIVKKYM